MNCSMSMVQECGMNQLQIIRSFGGAKTIFKITELAIYHHDLHDFFEEQADKHKFRSGMDWYLCLIYPEEKKDCFRFYDGKGKDFKGLHGRSAIRYYDLMLSACLNESMKKAG